MSTAKELSLKVAASKRNSYRDAMFARCAKVYGLLVMNDHAGNKTVWGETENIEKFIMYLKNFFGWFVVRNRMIFEDGKEMMFVKY